MDKKNVIFWESWQDAIKKIPSAEERADAYSAIIEYGLYGNPYEGNSIVVEMLMAIAMRVIDEQKQAYAEKVEKLRANASKSKQKQAIASKSKQLQANANNCKQIEGVNDNVNVTDKDKDTDVINNDNINKESNTNVLRKNFNAKEYLLSKNVDEDIADAWLIVRKNKKAPATELAMKLIDKEVAKAGITWNEAISECVLRNWQGFKASWLHKDEDRNKPQSQYTAEDLALVQAMFEH